MDKEFPDENEEVEAPLVLIPGKIGSQCTVKPIKDRLRAFDSVLAEISQENLKPVEEIAAMLPQMLKEPSALIL